MLSLIRGGEKAASHNLYTAFCLKQRIRGLQSEQEKERKWGQEVLVPPPERRSHVKATVEILLCGERECWPRGEWRGKACSPGVCIIHIISSSLH